MTLDEVCGVGQEELNAYKPFEISPALRHVEPIHEMASVQFGAVFTEEKVRQMVRTVLDGLAALPPGTWTTSSYQMPIPGIEVRTIQTGQIALTFRMQHDPENHDIKLHVGGYVEDARNR